MKLYFHQPSGHGPSSYFVVAKSKNAACAAINNMLELKIADPDESFYYGLQYPIKLADIQEVESGEVVENANE